MATDEIVYVYCYTCGTENDKEATECENCHKKDSMIAISREQKEKIIRQMIYDLLHNKREYRVEF